jgi:hypothetical protein
MPTRRHRVIGVLGRHAGAPAWYRAMSAVLGFAGILSGLALVSVPALRTTLGGGTMERIAIYGLFIWQLVTGVSLLIKARRPADQSASTGAHMAAAV